MKRTYQTEEKTSTAKALLASDYLANPRAIQANKLTNVSQRESFLLRHGKSFAPSLPRSLAVSLKPLLGGLHSLGGGFAFGVVGHLRSLWVDTDGTREWPYSPPMQPDEPPELEEPHRLLGLSKRGMWLTLLGLVALVAGLICWDHFGSWTPEQWSATAEVATAVVALCAAFVGLRQLREAQASRLQQERDALSIRRERAQPYVAVFMEPLKAVDPKFQELVVKNFGATAAYNVRIDSTPEIVREWEGEAQKVPLPLIPTLVPDQEWRVLWDFFPRRHPAGLPDRHDVKVRFEDSHGESFEFAFALDWAMNLDRLSVHTYSVHHGVKELKKVREQLAKVAKRLEG